MDKKVAIITGGVKSIGKAIALILAKNNIDVVINYNQTDPIDTLNELKIYNNNCISIKGNVANFSDTEKIVKETIENFGHIDYLINNAGITKDNLILRMTEKEFMDVIDVNLKGTFNMTKNVIKFMMKQKSGSIVNISSIVGLVGNVGQTNYAASKAGIIGLTKSIAKEFASKNIYCNAVAPGFIETDMTNKLSDELKKSILHNVPLNRFGKDIDVAKAVLFLLNQNYITGQVLNVDGGMVM